MVKIIKGIAVYLLLFISHLSLAQIWDFDVKSVWKVDPRLKVIHDNGKGISINNYYRKSEKALEGNARKSAIKEQLVDTLRKLKTPDEDIISAIRKGHFPVAPKVITISTVMERAILRDIPNVQENMFVIGNDEYSLNWAKDNKQELLRFNAVGVLTAVKDEAQLRKIHELLKPLKLMPISADFISKHFDIWTYPVLITPKGEFR